MQLIFILEQVLNGLLIGVYYLLIALGLSLIFSLGGIVNLAHGAFYAIGAYLTVLLSRRIGFAATFVAAPVLVGLLGIVIERLLFRRFYRADPILSLLLTFGLAMVAEQGLRMIFGASPLPYAMPDVLRGQLFVGDFIYPYYRLDDAHRRGGRRDVHLAADLPHAVRPRGARGRAEPRNGRRARYLARALHDGDRRASASASRSLPACCSPPIVTIHPAMGQEILTAAFVVVVIGGLGSFWGVVAGRAAGRRGARPRRSTSSRPRAKPRCIC